MRVNHLLTKPNHSGMGTGEYIFTTSTLNMISSSETLCLESHVPFFFAIDVVFLKTNY